MLFNSLQYILIFLPVVIMVYFSLNRLGWAATGKAWLALVSFVFYCWTLPVYGVLLLCSILFNYMAGVLIMRYAQQAHRVLMVAVAANLAVLAYYKYANFLVDNLVWTTGWALSLQKVILPIGISFFTFTQIAYLVDVYRKIAREYSILHYVLFVTYFPHLVAGPIIHHKEMMPQFADSRNNVLNWENVFRGLCLFSIGLFKKVIIADQFALWANAGYGSVQPLTLLEAWITSLSYTLQIYFDFSGYTDMAIGASLMLNIVLPLNFNSPYQAVNIQDFWRRWHMTLSRWLRDYVYIPLGGSRQSTGRTYINLLLTFLIGGLWHGASWTFVVWGALHGVATAAHKAWQDRGGRMPMWLGWGMTFLFVHISWVFFAADSLADAMRVLRGMMGLNGVWGGQWALDMHAALPAYSGSISGSRADIGKLVDAMPQREMFYLSALPWLLCWGGLVFGMRNSMALMRVFERRPAIAMGWMTVALAISLFVLAFMGSRMTEFIYFNF